MAARQSTSGSNHLRSHNVRKRACKACDRCRLRKSKCDGASPCSRCRADTSVCVFGERKIAHNKVYPKGYVEMIQQQQIWLVHGLRELYRRTTEGEGWPGECLKTEPNGHPLTHDILTRLGALDRTKGERFEDSPDTIQQELCRKSIWRQEYSDGAESSQSPVARSGFFSDAFSQTQTLPPTPPAYPKITAPVKQEPMASNPQFMHKGLPMQGIVKPLALQGGQQCPSGRFGSFDDMGMMITNSDYTNMFFDEPMSSPIYNCQMPLDCVGNDYASVGSESDGHHLDLGLAFDFWCENLI
ncbi:hypothetical protein N7489_004637 [Penicillium chrysogenum]|uniref:Pc03g00300 protein n=2 Tax=Penicillium chrysogenum species complex TaxID=254878 RepID=B6GVS6_PENRW|nr:uncharacterized protein N7489_004637 [Penicillium chrysogenum]KAJ5244541.1 hypothetical protein N7489_004637 [Penicillium chrysogenum]CAP78992.1 Pc03g00300 [Penicillium rubens Wisconsin 54-1255]